MVDLCWNSRAVDRLRPATSAEALAMQFAQNVKYLDILRINRLVLTRGLL